ncbi:hypothetical protein ACJQ40_000169 [Enterococcus faecium]
MAIVDTNKLQKLIDSNVPAYTIEKNSGVSRATIALYRKGTSNILNTSLDKAIKLQKFWEEYTMNEYNELKNFIEDDLIEKGLGYQLTDFDAEKLLDGEIVEAQTDKHTKVYMSLNEIDLGSFDDNYMADFCGKEIYVYYVAAK